MATSKRNLIVSSNEDEEVFYVTVPASCALGISDKNWSTGVSLREVYYTPKSKRLFAVFYSIWQSGNSGACVGSYVHEVTGDVAFCEKAGIDPETVGIVPVEVE